ncbi:MAG TPA: polysaccharide biosynthesis/export family protein [bacterium]|nr:polysaccharide biosynthesis/export family protein [bacterium]
MGQPSAFSQPMVAAPLQTELSDKVYTLGPDDELSVVISGKGGYRESVDVAITPQGTVMLPMVNKVRAGGLTLTEFSKKVERLLGIDYLVSPRVYITLKARKSHKVRLVGEIASSGTYYLQAESELLKDVIIRAGGPVNGFNKTGFLIRLPSSGESAERLRTPERYTFNLLELMNDTSGKLNVPVKAGDIIYVLSGEHAREFSGSEEGNVLVFGQVRNPGIITYSKGLTALRAILKAGNFTEVAARSRVQVKRKAADGKLVTLKVNINEIIEGGDQSADLLLQPGDVVYVPRSIF